MGESRQLDLVSTYMQAPVIGAHIISLRLDESEAGHMKGKLTLDPNTCTLDRWGDHGECTKMAVIRQDATATAMKALDPQGHDRVLWVVDLQGTSTDNVNLIEYPQANLWYLTAGGAHGTAVVPLFDARLFTADPAGTIQMRYGMPLRDLTQRGDINEMRAEADVVRNALEALDAHPEIGQARRLDASHVADVRAALAELDDALANLKD
ncbi:hypothetical protein KXD96_15595 [Mycobacterium sp. SMC-2]|uniref:hypothetical protein n=1 Tax=Mycobacterium sp. SMC-2 TaxID=2857058 RepID=UPI0021B30A2B|nr:hypothetical protein [Mycobacterium sp. SMC-2]UXA04448.1 hypothetical protein KXD96_15595 [Mycobacterium sp. SMC-2]